MYIFYPPVFVSKTIFSILALCIYVFPVSVLFLLSLSLFFCSYNIHIITIFKCTLWWLSIHLHCCTIITTTLLKTFFFYPSKLKLFTPLTLTLHFSVTQPWQPPFSPTASPLLGFSFFDRNHLSGYELMSLCRVFFFSPVLSQSWDLDLSWDQEWDT